MSKGRSGVTERHGVEEIEEGRENFDLIVSEVIGEIGVGEGRNGSRKWRRWRREEPKLGVRCGDEQRMKEWPWTINLWTLYRMIDVGYTYKSLFTGL